MRIITWNVNGLRAHLKKEAWEWSAKQKADAICYQEIKSRPDQLTQAQHDLFGDHDVAWNPAERPGYSGVATFTRPASKETIIGFGNSKFDEEGRVIQTRFDDFILFNVYFPSGTSGRHRVDYKLEFYEALLKYLNKLHSKGEKIVVTGDYNTAFTEMDLARPKDNEKNSGFLPEEREMLGRYFDNGFVDAFRSLHPDKVQYTWWTARSKSARENNIGWRIDYFLVSEALMPRVKSITIHDQVQGSDHCPLELVLA
ncbi:MAG: exodeoxyribonuclease III [Chloroflexi bacterium]|nr:exodeoxyribonuclease III [Chloroflexota bacterium]